MITIPKPCHEDWEKMSPKEQGRHCEVCSKVVIDFSDKTEEEIYSFFRENSGKKVCGNFRNDQLTAESPRPFFPSAKKQNRYRVFMAALVFVFGGFLFSSCSLNDLNDRGQKLAMLSDTPNTNEHLRGKVKYIAPEDTAKTAAIHSQDKGQAAGKLPVCPKNAADTATVVSPEETEPVIKTKGEVKCVLPPRENHTGKKQE